MTRDSQFIETPDDWPCWPYLPLKRGKARNPDELGVVRAGHTTTVFLTLLFLPITDETPSIEYGSHAELFADGWLVD